MPTWAWIALGLTTYGVFVVGIGRWLAGATAGDDSEGWER